MIYTTKDPLIIIKELMLWVTGHYATCSVDKALWMISITNPAFDGLGKKLSYKEQLTVLLDPWKGPNR